MLPDRTLFSSVTLSVALLVVPAARAGTIHEDAKLHPSDPAAGSRFGAGLAVDGDVAVAGSPDLNLSTGAAYVFERGAGTWSQTSKLVASDATVSSSFGFACDVQGDTIVVGAFLRDNPSIHSPNEGAVYVFERVAGAWTETQLLTAPDASFDDYFGYSVALDGVTLVVGAPGKSLQRGSVYVFERSGGSYVPKGKLLAPDGAAGDRFGDSVAVSADTVMVGAPYDDDDGTASGVGFAFQRVGGAWIFNAKIRPPGLEAIDQFGLKVAVDGTCAAFTAPGDDDVQVDAGAIHLYERSGSTWALANKLQAAVPVGGDQLGRGLDFAFGTLAASTYASEAGPKAGAVRLFRRLAGTWTEEVRIVPSDAANDDYFGQPIAIGDDVVLVAARSDDDFGADSGSVYVTGRRFFAHGTGCLGTGGFTPVLDAWGDPVPGGSVVLDVADALGGAPLFLFLGAQAAELDMGAGCVLNLQPAVGPYGPVPLQGSGAGNGALMLPFGVPAAFPSVTVHLQAFVVDAGAEHPGAFAASNGFAIRLE